MTPQHLAFIMDGNRRWAKAHKLEILRGHNRGAEQIEVIVDAAARKNIPYITFWAFSTENWKREEKEVSMLFTVFRNVLSGPMVKRLIANGVKLQIIGDYKAFPEDIVQGLEKLMEASRDNTKITATIALNYGGRSEILRAVNSLVQDIQQAVIPAEAGIQAEQKKHISLTGSRVKSFDLLESEPRSRRPELMTEGPGMTRLFGEEEFSSYLYTAGMPDPDMVIRTGGEQRLSGFLAWQCVYSELYFTSTLWPDFDEKDFAKALEEFENRERRFGK